MSEKGKLRVRKTNKGKFVGTMEIGGKSMPLPAFYELKDDHYEGCECEVEREKGQIIKVTVDGRELPRRDGGKATPASQMKQGFPQEARPISATTGFKIFLPKDTAQHLPQRVENFGLLLNKLALLDPGERRFVLFKKDDFHLRTSFEGIDFAALERRRQKGLEATGLLICTVRSRSRWRMVVGLGGESVYETSLTLHPIYGFPYIPGSAVKGAVRSAVVGELFGGQEEEALKDPGFRLIFGSGTGTGGGRQGALRFFDAYPARPPKVLADVMNPHYGPYYRDGTGAFPPGDFYNPIPVFFLAVEDAELVFHLGIRKEENEFIEKGVLQGKTVLDQGSYWLERVLAVYGLGAKTSVGYGLLETVR